MSPEDETQPQPYEAGPPATQDEGSEADRARPPTREELKEHNEKIASVTRPMGPEPPEELARDAPQEDASPTPDVPPAPPPEPADN
jgi:hypothetical protein